jgi:MYND finger
LLVLGAIDADIDALLAPKYIDKLREALVHAAAGAPTMPLSFVSSGMYMARGGDLETAKRLLASADAWAAAREKLTAVCSGSVDMTGDVKSWLQGIARFLTAAQLRDAYWVHSALGGGVDQRNVRAVARLMLKRLPDILAGLDAQSSLDIAYRIIPETTKLLRNLVARLTSCAFCGADAIDAQKKLQSCTGCAGDTWYCDDVCQKSAWLSGHRQACPRKDRAGQGRGC